MPPHISKDRIAWFKSTFRHELEAAVRGTPYCIDLLAAIAYQETGYLWGPQIKNLTVPEILAICTGDTLDQPKRSAFPKTRRDLEQADNGKAMFRIARSALEHVGNYDKTLGNLAKKNPDKFCHGFGIFQYDLQFFKEDPDYFLQKKWHVFDICVFLCVKELLAAQGRMKWNSKTELTDFEKALVAIAYNKGKADPAKGLKQGYKSNGKYYGENIAEFLKIAQSIPNPAPAVDTPEPAISTTVIPVPIGITLQLCRVAVNSFLSLRTGPGTQHDEIVRMPPGQLVQRISESGSWSEIEAAMESGPLRGYAHSRFLEPATVSPVITEGPPTSIDLDNVPAYIRREVDMPDKEISGGDKGVRVRRVQEWLWHHGFRTSIDEDFGPATRRCVENFQKKHRIKATGSVDSRTWETLVAPLRRAMGEPKGVKGKSLAATIREVARQHLKEHPVEIGGDNRGPWVRLYCRGNDGRNWAWCAGFVTLIMKQACFYRGHQPPLEGSESCDSLANQAKAAGLFVPESSLSSGKFKWRDFGDCGVFLRRRTSTDWTHTGFSLGGDGDLFETIEGNTNDVGSREGFEACARTRSLSGSNYDFIRFE
ncbi:peptidoglycan-binding protein [Luteolibacter marinus]|uniref:peptidoglycan-binding protein n=1 Tax=Luteolibacter marinus TaxID=2776705 RepID=UPI001D0220A9|nr:peptidoglycan-binding protein [Luteolibacter marinus]